MKAYSRAELLRELSLVVAHLDGGKIRDEVAIYTVNFIAGPSGVITARMLREVVRQFQEPPCTTTAP